MNRNPSQKTGREKPRTANTITARSTQVPAFQAATTPIGTASSTANSMVQAVSVSVGSRRWPMSLETGRLEKIDVPRSPRTTCHSQMASCLCSGASSPSLWRMRSISSGEA